MKARCTIGLAMVLVVMAPAAWSGTRPRVAVRFEVESVQYRRALSTGDLPGFCASAGVAVAGALAGRERFLEFVPGGNDPIVLRVALVANEATPERRENGAVSLRLTLTRSGVDPVVTEWLFREATVTIKPADLIRELQAVFELGGRPDLQSDLLSTVSIADSCLTQVDTSTPEPEVFWVIPHTMQDLCTDAGTRFRLRLKLESGILLWTPRIEAQAVGSVSPMGSLPPFYHGRMLASAIDASKTDLDRIRANADRLKVEAVYVTDVVPLPACQGLHP